MRVHIHIVLAVCIHMCLYVSRCALSILRFAALKFLFRFLFELFQAPALALFRSLSHLLSAILFKLLLSSYTNISSSRYASRLLILAEFWLPPTGTAAALLRRCYAIFVCVCLCVLVLVRVCAFKYMGQLEVLGENW